MNKNPKWSDEHSGYDNLNLMTAATDLWAAAKMAEAMLSKPVGVRYVAGTFPVIDALRRALAKAEGKGREVRNEGTTQG